MKSLFLSAALPVLILAAGPALAQAPADPAAAAATNPPPHFPRDLSPEGVKAADDHLALEEVDGAEARAFVAASNEKALSALTGDRRYEPFRQQAEAILTATDRIPQRCDEIADLLRFGEVTSKENEAPGLFTAVEGNFLGAWHLALEAENHRLAVAHVHSPECVRAAKPAARKGNQ